MVVVPSGPVATCGLDALWPVVERLVGVLKVVAFAARAAACTVRLLPSELCQVMVVVPSGPVATCGLYAYWPVAERSIGVLKVVAFAARVAACTMRLLPLTLCQVMVVVPSGPVATCGLDALWPVTERSIGGFGSQGPSGVASAAALVERLVPAATIKTIAKITRRRTRRHDSPLIDSRSALPSRITLNSR